MGIVLLLAVGGVLGWVCSIVLAENHRRAIFIDIASGSVGSATLGLLMTSGSLIDTLSPTTFLYGVVGALTAVAISKMVRRTSIDQ